LSCDCAGEGVAVGSEEAIHTTLRISLRGISCAIIAFAPVSAAQIGIEVLIRIKSVVRFPNPGAVEASECAYRVGETPRVVDGDRGSVVKAEVAVTCLGTQDDRAWRPRDALATDSNLQSKRIRKTNGPCTRVQIHVGSTTVQT
jgi:hypothetical protein